MEPMDHLFPPVCVYQEEQEEDDHSLNQLVRTHLSSSCSSSSYFPSTQALIFSSGAPSLDAASSSSTTDINLSSGPPPGDLHDYSNTMISFHSGEVAVFPCDIPHCCFATTTTTTTTTTTDSASSCCTIAPDFSNDMGWHILHHQYDALPNLLHVPEDPPAYHHLIEYEAPEPDVKLIEPHHPHQLISPAHDLPVSLSPDEPRQSKRPRGSGGGCFTLENVSQSLQQHTSTVSGSSCAADLSTFSHAIWELNGDASHRESLSPVMIGEEPPPRKTATGGIRGSTYKYKETVEPQSIAARQRRKKISERIRELEKLIPGGNKLDTASMLDEAIRFVKFLQIQVQLLEAVGGGDNNHGVSGSNTGVNVSNGVHNYSLRVFPFSSAPAVDVGVTRNGGGGSGPLVLTETLQHALFKHRRCVATVQQCPVEHLLL